MEKKNDKFLRENNNKNYICYFRVYMEKKKIWNKYKNMKKKVYYFNFKIKKKICEREIMKCKKFYL